MPSKNPPHLTDDEIRRYEARLAQNPTSPAFAALAEAYRRAGRTAEAIALCRTGLERFPHYATARFVLAKAHVDQGELEAGRREIEQLLALEPDHEPALRLAVDLCLRQGEAPRALDYLRHLVDLDPADRAAQSRLRVLEAAIGTPPPGADGLSSILADHIFATVTFGNLLLGQGLYDEASAVFTKILLREPNHPVARERLETVFARRAQSRRFGGG